MKHGHVAYSNGCRCSECRTAHTKQHRIERARRAAAIAADPSLAAHGSAHTYKNWGCRCRPCTDAASAERRVYRSRRAS